MSDADSPKYKLKKVSVVCRICPTCLGKKTVSMNMGSGVRKEASCSTCCGTGVYKDERETDITLTDALTELGIRFILPASMKPE